MSKELIAEARKHLSGAADAAPKSAREAILSGSVEDERLSLVARLADALEAASRRAQKAESALNRVHGYVESACESVSCGKGEGS